MNQPDPIAEQLARIRAAIAHAESESRRIDAVIAYSRKVRANFLRQRLLVSLRHHLNLREKRAAREWRKVHCQPLTPEHLERLRVWAAQQKEKP